MARPRNDSSAARKSARPGGASANAAATRQLPMQVARARDELFADADRHGPRFGDVVRRAIPALAALPLAVALAAVEPWRGLLAGALDPAVVDVLLVAPVIAALAFAAGAIAPLARCSAPSLLLVALPLLGLMGVLVRDGALALATIPGAFGSLLLGIVAARTLRRAVWALPVLLAAGISDAQSFQGGVTRRLLEEGVAGGGSTAAARLEPLLRVPAELVASVDFFVLHVPVASGTWLLGLVDVVALGVLLGLTHLYWLPPARTALALGAVLVLVLATGSAMPVLPLLGIAWAMVHVRLVWRSTRFSLRRLTYLGG